MVRFKTKTMEEQNFIIPKKVVNKIWDIILLRKWHKRRSITEQDVREIIVEALKSKLIVEIAEQFEGVPVEVAEREIIVEAKIEPEKKKYQFNKELVFKSKYTERYFNNYR